LVLSGVGGFGPAPQVCGFVADTSIAFAETLVLEGIAASIGSVGDAYDNALAQTTIGLFKTCGVRPGELITRPRGEPPTPRPRDHRLDDEVRRYGALGISYTLCLHPGPSGVGIDRALGRRFQIQAPFFRRARWAVVAQSFRVSTSRPPAQRCPWLLSPRSRRPTYTRRRQHFVCLIARNPLAISASELRLTECVRDLCFVCRAPRRPRPSSGARRPPAAHKQSYRTYTSTLCALPDSRTASTLPVEIGRHHSWRVVQSFYPAHCASRRPRDQ
jgi:hypothetical protein